MDNTHPIELSLYMQISTFPLRITALNLNVKLLSYCFFTNFICEMWFI